VPPRGAFVSRFFYLYSQEQHEYDISNRNRNRLIDQLMAIKDADYLQALSNMIDRSHIEADVVPLSEEQKIMLTMSEEDINAGRTIDQNVLNEQELRWLKGK
jgi:2-phospho-L-lactate transferase/gluconeogenesis factor (CofD/UPF0052 family)